MDLLKYLAPMKNMPERFSNLAFWRGVRKLKDEVVNAFEYLDSWGGSIESKEGELEKLINSKSGFALLKTINLTIDMFSVSPINGTYFLMISNPPTIPNIPENCKFAIIYCNFIVKYGSVSYDCRAIWASPVVNSSIIFPERFATCRSIINGDGTPTITLATGSCWCYG